MKWMSACLTLLPAIMVGAQLTVSQKETLADSFDSGGFDGNDGSIDWSGSWTQMLGVLLFSGLGGCASGSCLRLTSAFFGLVSSSRGADLSAFSSGAVSFDYRAFYDPETGEADVVVVSNGTTYTLGSIPPTVDGQLGSAQYEIPAAYLTTDFRIQFQGNAGGQGAFTDVIVDNVVLTVQTNDPTSSTAPAAPTGTPQTPYPTPNPTNHSGQHPTHSPIRFPTVSSPTLYPSSESTSSATKYPTRYPTHRQTGPRPTTPPTVTNHSTLLPTQHQTPRPTPAPTIVDTVVMGFIDGPSGTITNASYSINGWACQTGFTQSIRIHVYLGGKAGQEGQLFKKISANRASEPAVANACQSTGTAYRFQIPITRAEANQHGAKTVFVHGISIAGTGNRLMHRSGQFTIPTVTASQPTHNPTSLPTKQPTLHPTRRPTQHTTLLPTQHKLPRKTRAPTQHKPPQKKPPQKKPPQKKPPQKKLPQKKPPRKARPPTQSPK